MRIVWQGYGCTDGPKCAHCGVVRYFYAGPPLKHLLRCPACNKLSQVWFDAKGPVRAWYTWQVFEDGTVQP